MTVPPERDAYGAMMLAASTAGWQLARTIDGDDTYVAVIETTV